MAGWYTAPPHTYQGQIAPAPLQQHHRMAWSMGPPPPPPPATPAEQAVNYSQPYHHHPPPHQGDYYSQVHLHQYPFPPQQPPAQPQFAYMYGQQDQVWHGNNNWGYQQWPYPAQSASLSQEEVWAAKARAWAVSKAVQDEPRPIQSAVHAPQMYQDFSFQPHDPHLPPGQQNAIQPLGQEGTNTSQYQTTTSQGQNMQPRLQPEPQSSGYDEPMQDMAPPMTEEIRLGSFDQKAIISGGQQQSNDLSSTLSSSHVHDAAPSYRPDSIVPGSPTSDRPDAMAQPPPKPLPAPPLYPQHPTHLLPQSQASPLISQPRLSYTDRVSPSGYDQPQQQQATSFHQPPQQPQVPPPLPPPPPQPHYQPPMITAEGVEGLSPGSLHNWAPVAASGMPFSPAMGAGTSQPFDPLHASHQLPVPWRPDGTGLQGLGFPSSGPFVVGSSASLGPGSGAAAHPIFVPDTFVERPKKAAVPSWLREELLKKKAAGLAGNPTGTLLSDDSSRVNGGEPAISLTHKVGISDKLRSSSVGLSEDEEEDEEEEIEAARTAAINQEIKRLLTEVLLKVTGDLFEEIAQEVLDEDDIDSSPAANFQVEQVTAVLPPSPTGSAAHVSGRVLVSSVKNSLDDKYSSDSDVEAGDVLGLGNYASDNETPSNLDAHNESLHGKSVEQDHEEYKERAHLAEGSGEDAAQKEAIKQVDDSGKVEQGRQGGVDKAEVQGPESITLSGNSKDFEGLTGKDFNTVNMQLVSEGAHMSASMERTGERQHASTNELKSVTLDNKEGGVNPDVDVKNRRKEEKEDKAKDFPSKDRKRDEKPKDKVDSTAKEKLDSTGKARTREERTKDTRDSRDSREERVRDVKDSKRGMNAELKDSSRDKRREKDKAKERSKARDDRDRRKHEKRDRESRSRRTDTVDKKPRRRSSSYSSTEGGSSSSSESRGRSRAQRSNRRRNSVSPPARSRKRRASHSRSRSRSPHAKHTHRRNIPSPSHDKSRRSRSKSPIHRRRHG